MVNIKKEKNVYVKNENNEIVKAEVINVEDFNRITFDVKTEDGELIRNFKAVDKYKTWSEKRRNL